MITLGVQSQYAINDDNPNVGFALLKKTGFDNVDFSLHKYLINKDIYQDRLNDFFNPSISDLEKFFAPHKQAAKEHDVSIHQMHMPYPIYVPLGKREVNDYLWHEVAPKSMELCAFFDCRYIVIHGFKLARYLGSEDAEWEQTAKFIEYLAPMAKEMNITVCIENLYDGIADHLIEGPCCDAKKCAERIDKINDKFGAEVLGFCFDTGHANLVGIDMEKFITTLGSRLKVLHIHDNDGRRDLHQVPFVFTKTRENKSATDWDGFLRGLRRVNYDGVFNFETSPVLTSFPQELRGDALGFIAKIGWYFKNKV